MHVAQNCCAVGLMGPGSHAGSTVAVSSFEIPLRVGCLQEATASEPAASGERTAVQELPGPSQSEQSPARPQRPGPQDAHPSPHGQVHAMGLKGCLNEPLPLAVHLCCSWHL